MVHLVVFINLFLIPLLPLCVINKKKLLKPNLDLLFQYGIITVCNVLLAKVPTFLIKKTAGIYISIYSGYYTVAALLSAVLIIIAYKIYSVYYISWKERIVQKGIKGVIRDLAPACVLLFAGCFMLLVFEPILMYATNIDDFWFDFQIMIGPVLIVFAGFFLTGFVLIFAIYNIDLAISKRLFIYKGITLAGFIAFVLLYLQGNWLAGNLPPLEGEEIVWEDYGKYENFVLLLALIVLAAAIAILIKKRGLDRTVLYAAMCASIVFVMLFASLVPAVITNNALDRKDTFSPTIKNFNTISSNKNFLIFLVDSVTSQVFYDVMMEDDDFRGVMEDFTYYSDALSIYPLTRDSIPHILTGKINYCETNYKDYSADAYNHSPLFEKLTQDDYSINLYSPKVTWEGERNYDIDNSISISDLSVDLFIFMKQELKYVLFKYMPYGLKQFSEIETLSFNQCKITNSEYDSYSWKNRNAYKQIIENSTLEQQSQNYFQFIHTEGTHKPYDVDKDLNAIKKGSQVQKYSACLTMLKAYLQRLKDNGAYDNSVIVILADHSYHTGAETKQPYKYLDRHNPILFIKGINERHEMLESDLPVSYVDLQDAFSDLLDGKQSTELFAGLEPGRTRTVFWHGLVKADYKVEYETTGSAREPRKFTPTGNVYGVKE